MSFHKVIVAFAAAAAICVIAHPADAARKKVRHRAAAPAASSAAVTDAMHDARHERGYVCYTDHFHYGSSLGQSSRRAAEIAAIGSWESFVDFEYGSSWARFRSEERRVGKECA